MQRDLTLIAAIPRGAQDELVTLLRARGNELQDAWGSNRQSQFDAVTPLHFLSMFVVPPDGDVPAQLVLEASFDCDRATFLDQLVAANAPFLRDAYRHCVGYPAGASDQQLRDYLGTLKHGNQLFYVGTPGLSTRRIAEENEIATEVGARIEALNAPLGRRAQIVRQVWDALSRQSRERVLDTPKRPFWVRHSLYKNPLATIYWYLRWPLAIAGWGTLLLVALTAIGVPLWACLTPPPSVLEATRCWLVILLGCAGVLTLVAAAIWAGEFPAGVTPRMVWSVVGARIGEYLAATWHALPSFGTLLGLLALAHWQWDLVVKIACVALGAAAAAILVTAIVWLVRLARIGTLEPDDSVDEMTWDPNHIERVSGRENVLAQTHFVSITKIRPGLLRMAVLRCVLFMVHRLARIFYNPLGLFNTQSIHFARWTVIPGARLLFASNYDGGFGGYLGIFATLGGGSVSAIWGNTEGFPRTFLLYLDGARDEQRLKSRARESQEETLLWYRRYPHLSVATIERNAAIREELARFSREGFRVPEAELDAFLRRFATLNP